MKTMPIFTPIHQLSTPGLIVTGMNGERGAPPMPLAYFLNGYQRHHEKLTGMAGDWTGKRATACDFAETASLDS